MTRHRNDDEHPARERVRLSWGEQRRWGLFVRDELRHDEVSRTAREAIRECLDACAAEGSWCACPSHTAALSQCCDYLWRDSEPGDAGPWFTPRK